MPLGGVSRAGIATKQTAALVPKISVFRSNIQNMECVKLTSVLPFQSPWLSVSVCVWNFGKNRSIHHELCFVGSDGEVVGGHYASHASLQLANYLAAGVSRSYRLI